MSVVLSFKGVCSPEAMVALLEDLERLGVTYTLEADSHPDPEAIAALPERLRAKLLPAPN